ncbi:MAG TPA: hypothetical protein VE986_08115 [Hyphomicrobiales bacterium]|nr:hypothetical protein [Hyphomicrobiales bacterium]
MNSFRGEKAAPANKASDQVLIAQEPKVPSIGRAERVAATALSSSAVNAVSLRPQHRMEGLRSQADEGPALEAGKSGSSRETRGKASAPVKKLVRFLQPAKELPVANGDDKARGAPRKSSGSESAPAGRSTDGKDKVQTVTKAARDKDNADDGSYLPPWERESRLRTPAAQVNNPPDALKTDKVAPKLEEGKKDLSPASSKAMQALSKHRYAKFTRAKRAGGRRERIFRGRNVFSLFGLSL